MDAEQIIRFRFDEKGTLLRSESSMATKTSVRERPVDLVFDRPFLVLLQRVGASAPYFALWVDNAELLVPWSSK